MSRPARLAHYDKPVTLTMADRLLPTIWALEDVSDVELLCHGVLSEVRPRSPRTWADEQDDLAYLFEKAVVIHGKYRPELYPGIVFRPWLYVQLRQRLQDKYRHEEGRRRDKPRPESLDAPFHGLDDGAVDYGGTGKDRLERLVSGDPDSDPGNWGSDCGGLLAPGDRGADEDAGRDGDGADQADRGRDPGTAAWRDCPACGWRNFLTGPNGVPGWNEPEECGACGATLSLSGRLRSLAGNAAAPPARPDREAA